MLPIGNRPLKRPVLSENLANHWWLLLFRGLKKVGPPLRVEQWGQRLLGLACRGRQDADRIDQGISEGIPVLRSSGG